MKVLFLTHSFPRFPGDAAGSFVLRLAVALRAEKVEVQVVAPAAADTPARDEIDGIPVERFRYAPRQYETLAYTGNMAQDVARSWSARAALAGFFASELIQSARARARFQPEIIHAHWWFPSGVVAASLATVSRRPLVTTLHGTDVRMAKRVSISRPVFRQVMRQSAAVTAVSSWLAAETTQLAPGITPVVAPMPIATESFQPGGDRDPARLLFVGRLTPQKGLDHLFRALPLMHHRASLDVVGDGSAAPTLRALAKEVGVAERVSWHGHAGQSELAAHYQRAAAVVIPSTDEGLGLVAAEAMLCEAPVVAFRSGGLPDIVTPEVTGILVEPADAHALARALDRVIDQPAQAAAMGRAGRVFAAKVFAPETVGREYARIYRDAASRA